MARPESSGSGRDPARRRRLIAVLILSVGFGVAAFAYVTASPVVEDQDVYELEHSKRYVRDVERIGGKAGSLANDLDEWLASLWEGHARGYTIAVATAVIAGAYLLLTRPEDPASDR